MLQQELSELFSEKYRQDLIANDVTIVYDDRIYSIQDYVRHYSQNFSSMKAYSWHQLHD